MIFAGGCEELDWTLSVLFDAMGAMSSKFNQTPDKASRAYDVVTIFGIPGAHTLPLYDAIHHVWRSSN